MFVCEVRIVASRVRASRGSCARVIGCKLGYSRANMSITRKLCARRLLWRLLSPIVRRAGVHGCRRRRRATLKASASTAAASPRVREYIRTGCVAHTCRRVPVGAQTSRAIHRSFRFVCPESAHSRGRGSRYTIEEMPMPEITR